MHTSVCGKNVPLTTACVAGDQKQHKHSMCSPGKIPWLEHTLCNNFHRFRCHHDGLQDHGWRCRPYKLRRLIYDLCWVHRDLVRNGHQHSSGLLKYLHRRGHKDWCQRRRRRHHHSLGLRMNWLTEVWHRWPHVFRWWWRSWWRWRL